MSFRRLFLLALLLMVSSPGAAGVDNFEGVWCWGSPRKSADVPFLRISRIRSDWLVETKHYMHDGFVSESKGLRVVDNHLEFTYWYEPQRREASCSLDLVGDMMVGECDGERSAHEWGRVPTYLWRSQSPPAQARHIQ